MITFIDYVHMFQNKIDFNGMSTCLALIYA